jgi:hypothetical protein
MLIFLTELLKAIVIGFLEELTRGFIKAFLEKQKNKHFSKAQRQAIIYAIGKICQSRKAANRKYRKNRGMQM